MKIVKLFWNKHAKNAWTLSNQLKKFEVCGLPLAIVRKWKFRKIRKIKGNEQTNKQKNDKHRWDSYAGQKGGCGHIWSCCFQSISIQSIESLIEYRIKQRVHFLSTLFFLLCGFFSFASCVSLKMVDFDSVFFLLSSSSSSWFWSFLCLFAISLSHSLSLFKFSHFYFYLTKFMSEQYKRRKSYIYLHKCSLSGHTRKGPKIRKLRISIYQYNILKIPV